MDGAHSNCVSYLPHGNSQIFNRNNIRRKGYVDLFLAGTAWQSSWRQDHEARACLGFISTCKDVESRKP